MNFKLPQNRREGFIRWYLSGLYANDWDEHMFAVNHLFDKENFTQEQKLWYCWLLAFTYNLPTAHALYKKWPDPVDAVTRWKELTKWCIENYARLKFNTDNKYNKNKIPAMFKAYVVWLAEEGKDALDKVQRDKESHFAQLNFHLLWYSCINKLEYFGRFMTWLYLQNLRELAKLNIEAPTMFIGEQGNDSVTHGALYLFNREDLIGKTLDFKTKDWLAGESIMLLKECHERWDSNKTGYKHQIQPDFFSMETCLCYYKKLFRDYDSRYLGFSLDAQAEEIEAGAKDWPELDFSVFWEARELYTPKRFNQTKKIQKWKFPVFVTDGRMLDIDEYFPDLEKSGLERFFV